MFKRKKKKARVEGGVETVVVVVGGAGGGGSGYAVSAKKCETKMKREGAETGGEQGSQMGKGCTGLGDKYFKRSFCVKTHTKTWSHSTRHINQESAEREADNWRGKLKGERIKC